MARVLLVEDEADFAKLIVKLLERAGFSVDACKTAWSAVSALAGNTYDCVVLDRGLPDGDGLLTLRQAREAGQAVPVLILSARKSASERVAGLSAGADDYLGKPFDAAELVARIHALLRRPASLAQKALSIGNLRFEIASRTVHVADAVLSIARRELILLEQFLRRAGQVLTRERIETALYGFDEDASSNAIEASVCRLRKALASAGADHRIHTIRGIGYCLAP